MQRAFQDHPPGFYHRYFGIPMRKKIPLTLLRKIKKSNIGDIIVNPTKVGKRKYHVTKLMRQRASFLLNVLHTR